VYGPLIFYFNGPNALNKYYIDTYIMGPLVAWVLGRPLVAHSPKTALRAWCRKPVHGSGGHDGRE